MKYICGKEDSVKLILFGCFIILLLRVLTCYINTRLFEVDYEFSMIYEHTCIIQILIVQL